MTESEMLELAAKAAGIDYKHDNADWKHDDHCAFWDYDDLCTCGARWNPQDDSDQAFWLAVKLRIDLIFMLSDENEGETIVYVGEDMNNESIRASLKDDPYAATRLAITRAAAEIGRNMK